MPTWLPHPRPSPRNNLPKISIRRFSAAKFRIAPMRKKEEANFMVSFRPYFLEKLDATKLATMAGK